MRAPGLPLVVLVCVATFALSCRYGHCEAGGWQHDPDSAAPPVVIVDDDGSSAMDNSTMAGPGVNLTVVVDSSIAHQKQDSAPVVISMDIPAGVLVSGFQFDVVTSNDTMIPLQNVQWPTSNKDDVYFFLESSDGRIIGLSFGTEKLGADDQDTSYEIATFSVPEDWIEDGAVCLAEITIADSAGEPLLYDVEESQACPSVYEPADRPGKPPIDEVLGLLTLSDDSNHRGSTSVWSIIGWASIGCGIFFAALAMLIFAKRKIDQWKQAIALTPRYSKIQDSIATVSSLGTPNGGLGASSPFNIQRTKTMMRWEIDFDELDCVIRIGRGASGEVLKATWRGTDVAVKRLWWDHFCPDGSGHGYTSGTEGSSPRDKYDSYRADVEKGKGKDGGSDGMNGSGCGNGANGISDVRTNSTKDTAQEPAANLSVLDFEREVEMLTHLRHPNIVLFLGACRVPPNMCVVMEFCSRGSLDALIHNPDVPMDRMRKLRMAIHTARGMHYLHSRNPAIIHRDLKPANLLVGANFEIKVCDFGVSRKTFRTQLPASSPHQAGTPGYIAPEVLKENLYTKKCDVWSFGVVLWELLTRERPFNQCHNSLQIMAAVAFHNTRLQLPPPKDDHEEIVHALHFHCCSTEPEDRPSFEDILEELSRAVEVTVRASKKR